MALMPFLALGLWTRGKVALKGGDISTPTGRFRLLMNMYTTKRTAILFHFDGSNIFNPHIIIGQVLYWICDSSYRGYLTLSTPLFLSI